MKHLLLARSYISDQLKKNEHYLTISKPFLINAVSFESNQEELPYHEKKQQIR